jgi:hypothetical protein
MAKPELEFFPTDDIPSVPVAGAPPGHYQKILTEDSNVRHPNAQSRSWQRQYGDLRS